MEPRRHLTPVTAPAVEPMTVAELKTFGRIDSDEEDSLLAQFITMARQAAEEFTRRAFITQAWKLSLDLTRATQDDWWDGVMDGPVFALYGGLPDQIELPRAPVQSISSVTTYSSSGSASTFASSNYTADTAGARLVLAEDAAWPSNLRPITAVEIVTVNGYGDAAASVPMPIRMAIQIHAALLYETRGACGCDVPSAAQQLLRQYRLESL